MPKRTERVLAGIPDPAYLRRLMHFLAVARAGGFRRAAALAGVQQPTLSKSVRELEAQLDRALFIRRPRGLGLTAFGETLLQRCEAIESLAERPATEAADAVTGDVRIATQEHVAAHLLPDLVTALGRQHPRLHVRITTGPAQALLPGLEDGYFDFALFFSYPEARALTRRSLGRHPCQIVVASHAAENPDVLRRFIGSREIEDAGNRSFPTLMHLRRRDRATAITLSTNSLEAHRRLVLAGCGISILPRFMVRDDLTAGRLVLVDPGYVYHARLDLLQYQKRRPSAAAKAALDVLAKL